jgi:ABC-type polysaccharide/polyol phosphate export permease
VVVGRTASDVIYNALSMTVMATAGLIVGWRIHNGIGSALLGFGLLLLFAYAVSWVMAFVGLAVPSHEVVNSAAGMVIFPLTFVANTFVPADNFPTPLRIFAEWNPISAVTQAARELFGNIPPGAPEPGAWALQHAVLYTLIWVVAIIAMFAPLAIRKYTTRGSTR